MAATRVSDTETNTSAAANQITLASVPGSTGNCLVVGIAYETGTNPGTTITGVTYGGVAMTEEVFIDALGCAIGIYTLVSPSGTASVVANFSATSSRILLNAAVYDGVNTSAPVSDRDETQEPEPATSISLTLTAGADDMVYDVLCRRGNDTAGTVAGANQTQLASFGSGTSNRTYKMSDQDGADGGVMSWTIGTGADCVLGAITIAAAGGAAPPTVTDVDEDNTITLEQANVEIDGTDFDTATVEIRQGGFVYEPSIDSQNGTTIVFDMAAIGATGPVDAPHAGAATLAVVNGDAQEDTHAITIEDESGEDTVLVGTPNADPDLRLTGTPDVAAGDYVRWFNVVGGAIGDVTVNDDLTFDVTEGVTSFDFQVWDSGDGTWGDVATQTIEAVDEVPDAFSFVDATNAPLSTVITSDAVVPAGYDTADISVTGGEYSINAGAFTADPGTVTAGDSIRARGTSSGSNSTTVNVAVTIGGVSDTFSITTLAASSGTSKYMTLLGVG